MTRLRTQLLFSGLVIVLLMVGLLVFILWERQHLNADVERLFQLGRAVRQARELSLYAQYNAHDTNAYALGHVEHRQEFGEHGVAFDAVVTQLQQAITNGLLEEDEQDLLDQIKQMRATYMVASTRFFTAADAHRTSPSAVTQREQDVAWEATDVLGDQLDDTSQDLAQQIGADEQRLQDELIMHTRQFILLIVGLGILMIVLITGIVALSSQALGRPLQSLVASVHQITAGNYAVPVATGRRDEVGVLARAIEQMAITLQTQVGALQQREEQLQNRNQELERLLETIRELETPAIPLWEGVLVVPFVGYLDTRRIETMTRTILMEVYGQRTQTVIIDITGVPLIDTAVARHIEVIAQSIQLLGARVILTGMRAELAGAIVKQGIDLMSISTVGRLQDGVALVLGAKGHLRSS